MAARLPSARRVSAPRLGGILAGWRGLRRFWIGITLALGITAGVLQVLGTPPALHVAGVHPVVAPTGPGPLEHAGPETRSHTVSQHGAEKLNSLDGRPGRGSPGPIADPDPSLLQPYADDEPKARLPRIAADGRAPMSVYAAGFDRSNLRPRVGMLIAGIGMSEADSMAAIKNLPGGVTLAVSPYAGDLVHLLDVARMTEHEYLLSIPMEPQGYPVNDPDDRHALMTSLPPAENLIRLSWVLSRLRGYVGVTDAFGQMRGDRLAAVPDQFAAVLEEVGQRGLLFIDARTGRPARPDAWTRSVDVAIDDEPLDAAAVDQRLEQLTHTALDKGSALGIVWLPRPMVIARVAAWTNTLTAKGAALAPVSALVLPPVKQEGEK